MCNYFIFCIVLFIPHLSGNSITPSAVTKLLPTNTTVEPILKDLNNTKVTLATEGGSVEPEQPITLPKENHSNLINLDKELGKTKVKSIVPRKGVKYIPAEDSTNSTNDRIDTTIPDKTLEVKGLSPAVTTQTKPSTPLSVPSAATNETKVSVNVSSAPEPVVVRKKPLIVSVEAIHETERKVALAKAAAGTSIKPEVHDQLPLPKVKYEKVRSSHPGMVMPVVITMLVVPMFAVLGYMALRRGQEAWKNRHYKRMDFLLDGMYNE